MADDSCYSCGALTIESLRCEEFPFGVVDTVMLEATVPVMVCTGCGSEFTDSRAEVLRTEAVCRHTGTMSPAQIRQFRASLGMTIEEFAAFSKIRTTLLLQWEDGIRLPDLAMDMYLKLLKHEVVQEIMCTYE